MKGKIIVGGKNPTAVSNGEKKNLRQYEKENENQD